MAIKVIVELQAKPGGRAELKSLMEEIVAEQGPSQNGFLGSTRYEALDNPDLLIEIADWSQRTRGWRICRRAQIQASTDL